MPQLTGLHIYPIKSTYRHSPDSARVEPWGLAGDRRWMFVTPDGKAVTQREVATLGQYRTELRADGGLTVTAPDGGRLTVPAPSADSGDPMVEVSVFSSRCKAAEANADAQRWVAERLPETRLVHLDDPLSRAIEPDHARPGETVSLADGYPLLVTTTASLEALNEHLAADHPDDPRLGAALPMTRFRPNLVVDGTRAWEEDDWRRIQVGEVVFRVLKPCGRCVVTTHDQETSERVSPEPLKALARHHRLGKKLAFGMNLIPERPEGVTGDILGTVRVGDEVTILE